MMNATETDAQETVLAPNDAVRIAMEMRRTGRFGQAERVGWLEDRDDAFDLIVCADTLGYFGALGAVFAAVQQALRHGGHFVFSVESADDLEGASEWRLHPHGRYAHRSDYARDRLATAGLRQVSNVDTALRRELGRSVAGMVFTAGGSPDQSPG